MGPDTHSEDSFNAWDIVVICISDIIGRYMG